jgi:hypothetical protein
MRIKSPKDFWAGLMFLGFGSLFSIWAMTHYKMGTALRMGPAYFPTLLGALLAFLGLVIFLQSLAVEGSKVPAFKLRPLSLILVGCLAYAYLMRPLGLVLATAALVFLSALGGSEFKLKEVALLYVVLIIFSVLVFVKGLTLPFPLWPEAFS